MKKTSTFATDMMISSHVKNNFWDIDFSPLYNAEAELNFPIICFLFWLYMNNSRFKLCKSRWKYWMYGKWCRENNPYKTCSRSRASILKKYTPGFFEPLLSFFESSANSFLDS
jgi:hypothetical protein